MCHNAFTMDSASFEFPILPLSTQNPANPNADEIQKLKNFAQQGSNLTELGWNLNDYATWSGVSWTTSTPNRVQHIDFSYENLSGALNLSSFTALEHVDIAGNLITQLDLSGCNSLVHLDCFNNALTSLTVPAAETVDCTFNQLTSLTVNNAANLKELYCGSNALTVLNLSANTQLAKLDCSNNDLSTLNLPANNALTTLSCEYNYLDIQESSALFARVQTMLGRTDIGAMVSYTPQKVQTNPILNASEVSLLQQFANQGTNRAKLGWTSSNPEEWMGVQWVLSGNEYRVQALSINSRELTGALTLTGMTQLTHVYCYENNLTSLVVSNNSRLALLAAGNAGLRTLSISNNPLLRILNCEDNYLNLSDIIANINIIKARENAWVTYENQKLLYDFTLTTPDITFDAVSETLMINTIQFAATGIPPASVFIEVNKYNDANIKIPVGSGTVSLNSLGTGTYSFAASPITVNAAGESVEILVYTNNDRVQLVTQLFINQILF